MAKKKTEEVQHLEVQSLGKATFNDPFADVDVHPVAVAGENVPTRIAVRVKDDQGRFQVASILGKDYPLLPNRKVRDMAEDVMSRAPAWMAGFRNLKKLWDGKHYVDYFVSNAPIVGGNGEKNVLELNLGLMVWNAYDGTRKTGFEVFALNPWCTNQYHSRNRFGFFAWRHTPGEVAKIDMEDVLRNISVGVQNVIAVAPMIQELKARPLTLHMLTDVKKKTDMPQSRWGDVLDALDKEDGNAFGLYQALTNVCSHKLTGMSAISTGTGVTDYFLQVPPQEVVHHTTAAAVVAGRE